MRVFLYTDPEFELEIDNIFLSGVYKDLKSFLKQNPDYRPLKSYLLKDVESLFKKGKKDLLKKKNKLNPRGKIWLSNVKSITT